MSSGELMGPRIDSRCSFLPIRSRPKLLVVAGTEIIARHIRASCAATEAGRDRERLLLRSREGADERQD